MTYQIPGTRFPLPAPLVRFRSAVQGFVLPIALLAPGTALATNGYFSHGFGVQSQGLAGVGIALPMDGLAAANNPAGTALVGDRFDLGLTRLRPRRTAEIHGNGAGMDGQYRSDGRNNFLVPEFGYVHQSGAHLATGIAVYGNGGLNTSYSQNPFRPLGATGSAGVNLEQLFVSPSLAYKLSDRQALGVAINYAYQRFEAKGIDIFSSASVAGDRFSDTGEDSSHGWGVRLGYTGEWVSGWTFGMTWASKTRTGRLKKYAGLLADGGSFDIPANYGIGVAWKPTANFTVSMDGQRIDYSDVNSLGNPISRAFTGSAFGTSNGPGLGWRDVKIVKLGINYQASDWTVRAGYSHATQPIPRNQTFLNILTPGVVRDHVSVGATWRISSRSEASVAYTYALRKKVRGEGSIPAAFGGGEADIQLYGDILGIAYGWKL